MAYFGLDIAVTILQVNLEKKQATVEYQPSALTAQQILDKINSLGFTAEVASGDDFSAAFDNHTTINILVEGKLLAAVFVVAV